MIKTNDKPNRNIALLGLITFIPFGVTSYSYSSENNLGETNLVTGKYGVVNGYNNIVTSIKGISEGNNSISTGGNVSREDFKLKLKSYQDLINQRNQKQSELLGTNTGLEANQQTQANLGNQIKNLNQLIDSARQKSTQLDGYNSQLSNKNNELNSLKTTLEQAKSNANTTSATGSGDKTVWTDFTAQLGKLNWNKLSDSSGGTSGVNKLATDLKGMIEKDYTEFTNKWSVGKYEEVINGYINRQGLFDQVEDIIGETQSKNKNYFYFAPGQGFIFGYDKNKNNIQPQAAIDGLALVNYLEKVNTVTPNEISITNFEGKKVIDDYFLNPFYTKINSIFNDPQLLTKDNIDQAINEVKKELNNHVFIRYNPFDKFRGDLEATKREDVEFVINPGSTKYKDITIPNFSIFEHNKKATYSLYNLKNIISSDQSNPIKNIAEKYQKADGGYGYWNSYDTDRIEKFITVLSLPPVKNSVPDLDFFLGLYNVKKMSKTFFKNELLDANNAKNFVKKEDIDKIRSAISSFYNSFYKNIDFNAPDENWLFDKNNYISQLSKVESFASKLRDYVSAYDKVMANPSDVESQAKLITLYNDIRENKDNPENYFDNISVKLKQSTIELYNKFAVETAKELTEDAKKLKLYDTRNEIIKGVLTEAQNLKGNIDKAQKAVDDKQKEIDGINKQIANLALTPDEQGAADVKAQKQKELEAAQRAKEQLEKDKVAREKELEEINRKIKETELANLGENSITYGTNAFASGNDSIAFGTNATAQHQNAIAIGKDTLVTGDSSIAIGYNSQVTGKQSIAIGVGHKVSGNNSTTIGDPNEVTGNNAFVAGNNNVVKSDNVMVVGNNINIGTGFNGAVVIGDGATVASANPYLSHKIAGTTYQFAGSPTAVFSVGAVGKERQLTNVAAGRISETSTDGINGSQLYAVISSLNQLSTGTNSSNENVNLEAGNHIAIQKEGDKTMISSTLTGGNGIQLDNNAISIKQGDGLTMDEQGSLKANVGKGILIEEGKLTAKGTKITAGENIQVTGDETDGYTISTKATLTEKQLNDLSKELETKMAAIQDTNTQSVTKSGNGVKVDVSDNAEGTKDYTVSIKKGEGLVFDESGNLTLNPNLIKAGDHITINGNVKEGFEISANVPTVSHDSGIEIISSPNKNGSTDYKIKAKIGRGLGFNDKGEIITTAQSFNAGGGVTIIEKGDESTIKVEGVTTQTDDGKVLKRQDLTESLNLRGGKNIKTTTEGSDIKIHLVDDIEVNSLQAKNGASIQHGLNMNHSRISHVADGQDDGDAVNVRQLNQAIISTHNQFDNKVNQLQQVIAKQNKQRKAGQASSLATAGLMQAFRAGQSGITAAVGQYQGQSAVAVGYSSLSDNGKLGIKFSLSTNSQKEFGGTIGGGYFW